MSESDQRMVILRARKGFIACGPCVVGWNLRNGARSGNWETCIQRSHVWRALSSSVRINVAFSGDRCVSGQMLTPRKGMMGESHGNR